MIIRICFGKKVPPFNQGSKILMWAEQFPASHCWLEAENSYSCFVYESVFQMSRRISKIEHRTVYDSVREFSFNISDAHDLYKARTVINNMMRIRYSFSQILIIGLGLISKSFARWSGKKTWNGKKRLICTELVGRFMSEVFAVDFKEKADTISLRDVYREALLLEKNHSWATKDN